MIRTFGTVIGISVGIVGLVFLTVVALLYRSGDSPLPETTLDPLAARDSSQIKLESMNISVPSPPTPSDFMTASTKGRIKSSKTTGSSQAVVKKTSSAVNMTRRSTSTTRRINPSTKKGEMSTNEYVERETYYLNKIDQSSDQVLQRSAEVNQQLADLKAQLEALQGPN